MKRGSMCEKFPESEKTKIVFLKFLMNEGCGRFKVNHTGRTSCTCKIKRERLKSYRPLSFVPPTGIEPISPEPESAILSIELQGQPLNEIAKVQLFWIYYKFFHRFFYDRSGEEPLEASPDRSEPLPVLLCSFGP